MGPPIERSESQSVVEQGVPGAYCAKTMCRTERKKRVVDVLMTEGCILMITAGTQGGRLCTSLEEILMKMSRESFENNGLN